MGLPRIGILRIPLGSFPSALKHKESVLDSLGSYFRNRINALTCNAIGAALGALMPPISQRGSDGVIHGVYVMGHCGFQTTERRPQFKY